MGEVPCWTAGPEGPDREEKWEGAEALSSGSQQTILAAPGTQGRRSIFPQNVAFQLPCFLSSCACLNSSVQSGFNFVECGVSERQLPLLVECLHRHPHHWKLPEEPRRGQHWPRNCRPMRSSKFPQFRVQPRPIHRKKQFLTARKAAISLPTAGNCPCKAYKNTHPQSHPITKASSGLVPLLLGPRLPVSTLPSTCIQGPPLGDPLPSPPSSRTGGGTDPRTV